MKAILIDDMRKLETLVDEVRQEDIILRTYQEAKRYILTNDLSGDMLLLDNDLGEECTLCDGQHLLKVLLMQENYPAIIKIVSSNTVAVGNMTSLLYYSGYYQQDRVDYRKWRYIK